jgi:hypothetical protein
MLTPKRPTPIAMVNTKTTNAVAIRRMRPGLVLGPQIELENCERHHGLGKGHHGEERAAKHEADW